MLIFRFVLVHSRLYWRRQMSPKPCSKPPVSLIFILNQLLTQYKWLCIVPDPRILDRGSDSVAVFLVQSAHSTPPVDWPHSQQCISLETLQAVKIPQFAVHLALTRLRSSRLVSWCLERKRLENSQCVYSQLGLACGFFFFFALHGPPSSPPKLPAITRDVSF